MNDVEFGFAAGCEPEAMPRRTVLYLILGYALSRFAELLVAKEQGTAQNLIRFFTAGRSHRLTSGGKAVALVDGFFPTTQDMIHEQHESC